MPLTYSEQGILIVEAKRALWNLITYIRLATAVNDFTTIALGA